jgi:VIT1/CCC1 family predicted Fe2+/Mn2+ transporter
MPRGSKRSLLSEILNAVFWFVVVALFALGLGALMGWAV